MYEVIKTVIESGRYELGELLSKIDVIWLQGDITDDQKADLVNLARSNATPENSYAPMQEQINQAFEQIKALEETVNANAKGMSAIKTAVEALGGTIQTPDPGPTEEYPEYKKPAGPYEAFNTGSKITFDGDRYECLEDGVLWNPVEYPQGWKKVS